MKYKHLITALVLTIICLQTFAQPKQPDKYPGLLWEITGNGLSRPSYLFGTMHVSNKLAFHLSDSFYYALKSVDEVALELNPELWQGQMARLDRLKDNYAAFIHPSGNDYVTQNSFRLNDYVPELTLALRTEPSVVNNLLYRSYKAREDFEEDTFLDLYIYQTGRKLGKKAAGVEDYYEAEKLVLEAYGDMAREKKRKNIDMDAANMRDIFEKIQNAYRRGDLELMDSLDNMMERSEAFREKFLFKRNEIQADAIDSIIKKASLFAGVGAAHLPGNRGVIEILRKKGYTLRPIKMSDRDGSQRNEIDKLKVPVTFSKQVSEDGFYSVDVPGELFRINQDYQSPDRRQFADMNNGSYYIVTRIKTYASFYNLTKEKVQKQLDSLLYENIPGKILSKKIIERNGYTGYDISARTRRGDLQRYHIFITPFEILIFKMSGKENYVDGTEAARFFSSIRLNRFDKSATDFQPKHGGFSVSLPHVPHQYLKTGSPNERWEYEAFDSANNTSYLIMKKSVYNFGHIDEDTFDLSLIEESFRNPELFDKQISRKVTTFNARNAIEVKERLKDSSIVSALYLIDGPHYYVIAERNKNISASIPFYRTFKRLPFNYIQSASYSDTILNIKAKTNIVPDIDNGLRAIIEQTADDAANGNNYSGYISYWPKIKSASFKSDSTGELVYVQAQQFPKYFSVRDSAKYWRNEIDELTNKNELIIASTIAYPVQNGTGILVTLKDTGSSRIIKKLIVAKGDYKYMLTSVSDSTEQSNSFINNFYSTFLPLNVSEDRNMYQSKLIGFFEDLFNTDSAIRARAHQALPNIYFGSDGVPLIKAAIDRLTASDKDYYDIKGRLIAELGYINDTASVSPVSLLKEIYNKVQDTIIFQNEVVKALSEFHTKESYNLLKELLIKDPPIFENNYDYGALFINLKDSLQLSAGMFPDILQLSYLDDYKDKVISLLVKVADSGFIDSKSYKKHFPSIFIDAKVALKKQKIIDEKKRQQENRNSSDKEPIRIYTGNNGMEISLQSYAVLLIPFYEKEKEVRGFFDGLLRSDDKKLKTSTAVLMLKNNLTVDDSIINAVASDDMYRALLFEKLEANKMKHRFPEKYRTQDLLTRSYLMRENDYDRMDSLVFLEKKQATIKGKTGYVYFYKYRIQADNDWKIAMAGLQPLQQTEVAGNPVITQLSDVRINAALPLQEQLNEHLKKTLFSFHKSGKNFFNGDD